MSVRKERVTKKGGGTQERYRVDVDMELPTGDRVRVKKVSPVSNRRGAEQYERELRQELLDHRGPRKEVPTFEVWFWGPDAEAKEPTGRFWMEWVISRRTKASEMGAKIGIYRVHLRPAFGHLALDAIGPAQVAGFRAKLVQSTVRGAGKTPLADKTINNILAVLSKTLRYAEEARVIAQAPRVALLRVERPEIECWSFEEYGRVLAAARAYSAMWYVAVLLAGDAGMRVGEVKALRWREDVDLVAGTLTINQQVRLGIVGTPKGRTRRTVPMTPRLLEALRALQVVRTGRVVRNGDGSEPSDEQAKWALDSIYRKAALPSDGWHRLRHSFGTHAALLGVNPWKLQAWLGHKRIDETMLYVHVAEQHHRAIPPEVLAVGAAEPDPDRRIVLMLGARGLQNHGHLTATSGGDTGNQLA